MSDTRAEKAIHALRTPDAALAAVPNTVRQSIADIIQFQHDEIERLREAMRMISLAGRAQSLEG